MTPQSDFLVLAPIVPQREGELRRLLASMNDGARAARGWRAQLCRSIASTSCTSRDCSSWTTRPSVTTASMACRRPAYPLYLRVSRRRRRGSERISGRGRVKRVGRLACGVLVLRRILAGHRSVALDEGAFGGGGGELRKLARPHGPPDSAGGVAARRPRRACAHPSAPSSMVSAPRRFTAGCGRCSTRTLPPAG